MQLNTNTYSGQSHSESVDLTARNFHLLRYTFYNRYHVSISSVPAWADKSVRYMAFPSKGLWIYLTSLLPKVYTSRFSRDPAWLVFQLTKATTPGSGRFINKMNLFLS
jgi:hypothetical protein